MEGNTFTIIATLVNFLILLFVLKHFFFNKVTNVINKRNSEVRETIDKANADRAKAEALMLQNQENLENSKMQGKNIVEEYKVKAEKVSSDILSEAHAEADSILQRAKIDAEREMEKAKDEIRGQIVTLSLLAASKSIGEQLDTEKHHALIREFISKVGV